MLLYGVSMACLRMIDSGTALAEAGSCLRRTRFDAVVYMCLSLRRANLAFYIVLWHIEHVRAVSLAFGLKSITNNLQCLFKSKRKCSRELIGVGKVFDKDSTSL